MRDKHIKFIEYSGENRCIKCCFAYDNKGCAKSKCTKEENNGKQGYYISTKESKTQHIDINIANI